MIPPAYMVHESDGRLRVGVPSKKGHSDYFSRLEEDLSALPGVEFVKGNPISGTVLLVHRISRGAIARYAAQKGHFALKSPRSQPKPVFVHVAEAFRSWNEGLKRATGGALDLPGAIFLSLVLSGIYQIARGNVRAPAWYTAFWYALGVFSKGHADEWDEDEDLLDDFSDGD